MVVTGKNVGQFVAKRTQPIPWRKKEDGSVPVIGFRQEHRGRLPIPVGFSVGLEDYRRPPEICTNQVAPGLDLREIPGAVHFPIVLVAAIAPYVAVKDQLAMVRRV